MTGERGSALVIAVLVMAIMTLLGVSFLLMADTENKIAENERLSAQALYFGEGVAREVKRWFDRPPYTTAGDKNLSRPTVGVLNRTRRHIDLDGAAGPSVGVKATGSLALPRYKEGVDIDGDGNDDIFDKPYRSDPKDMFVGTLDYPDIEMDRSPDKNPVDPSAPPQTRRLTTLRTQRRSRFSIISRKPSFPASPPGRSESAPA